MAGRAKLHPKIDQHFDTDILWSVDRARAALGGLHRVTIDRMVKSGRLVSVKIGVRKLITVESVKALIEDSTVRMDEVGE
jgi:hypothetical protein